MGRGDISDVALPSPTPSLEGGDSGLVAGEPDFFLDRFQNAVGVFEDVVVPETDDAIAVGFDASCSRGVSLGRMLAAIAFDSEFETATGEVDDVTADRELPRELCVERSGSQVQPEAPLGVRHIATELARHASQSLLSQRRTPIPNPFPRGKGLSVAKSS